MEVDGDNLSRKRTLQDRDGKEKGQNEFANPSKRNANTSPEVSPPSKHSAISNYGSHTAGTSAATQQGHDPGNVVLRYSPRDLGPYAVYVYSNNRDNVLYSTLISGIIAKSDIPDITEIKKVGRGKILIEVKTPSAANKLVENPIFPKHNLRAFIPAFKVLRTGVIQDVPQQIDIDSLRSHLESPRAKILDISIIQRLNRRCGKDGKVEYVPSKTIRVKFAGQILPQEVFLYKVRHEVRPFIPRPHICYSCHRMGHISSSCKSTPRCLYCGESKHNDMNGSCHLHEDPPKCINCQRRHWASANICPIVRNRIIVNLAAVENISIADARKIIDSNTPSPHPSGSPKAPRSPDLHNFPYLPRMRTHTESHTPENHNRFELLDEEAADPKYQSYADAIRSSTYISL
ncbi:hypothetical protein ALC60_08524 [Trachymyrmex zeteki]|uniref:CCHC-type domain-containing protein n=1 Tax=Mycetomoellerius zeteki TaxID=64791 RepID=A0A151WXG6_9HYME|nr:hypothetical protein ALC60_08524 [Trachymyrmex zeteki]